MIYVLQRWLARVGVFVPCIRCGWRHTHDCWINPCAAARFTRGIGDIPMGSNDHGPGDPDLWARCRKLVKTWRENAQFRHKRDASMLRECADELEKAMKR